MKKNFLLVFISVLTIALGCWSEPVTGPDSTPVRMPVNPNGDSELALLMRDMYEDGMKAKQMVRQGLTPEIMADVEKIHTATATEPEKAGSPAFKVHAISYLQAVEDLKKARTADLPGAYNQMVNACMNCHKSLCPGPVVRIKKMYLE